MSEPQQKQKDRSGFTELIGLELIEMNEGSSITELKVANHHLNGLRILHGAVTFAMADTGMGAALYSTLDQSELANTLEMKINYIRPIKPGARLVCKTTMVHRGRTTAVMDSEVRWKEKLVAKVQGTYAIIPKSRIKKLEPVSD